MLNDQQIINNTKITENDDGTVTMTAVLPDGDKYIQKAKNSESARKHIIQWCEAVRAYMNSKEEERQRKIEDAVARRKAGITTEVAPTPPKVDNSNPVEAVMVWYANAQQRIDELGEQIKQLTDERNKLRNERDKIAPVVKVWSGEDQ